MSGILAVRRGSIRPPAVTATPPNVTALSLPGNADNPILTPMPAAIPLTSLDVRYKGVVDSQSVNARICDCNSGPLGFALFTTGVLQLVWRSTAGFSNVTSSVAHGVTAGTVASLRATLRSDGGTGILIDFYKSADWDPYTDTGTWTAIGAQRTSTHPASLVAGSAALSLGGVETTTAGNFKTSGLQYFSVRPFGGAEVVKFDPTTVTAAGAQNPTSYTDPLGNVWSLSGATWAWLYTGAPGTVSDLQAVTQSNTSVALTWTAAASATSHQYRVNGGSWTTTSGSTAHTVTGLTAGTAYTFEVRGVNSAGNGAASNTASATTSGGSAANVITNGGFADDTGWAGFWYSGKSVTGGKALFSNSPAYDGIAQSVTLTAGKYYELTWTVSGYVSGNVYPFLTGGTQRTGTVRAANGTFVERLLVNSGNNAFNFQMETGGTLSVDDISLVGPYDTSTVGGT